MGANPSERPVAIDLFAGAGGLSLGFEQAGFDIAAAVDLDPIHAAIHELNFPTTRVLCASIRDISGNDIRRTSGLDRTTPIAAVIGGPPCQGFSLIGHRVLNDPRNELVLHFLRIVRELQPLTFLMENVPGMATGSHTQLLHELIDEFAEIGYSVRLPYRVLNAANYGVPQDRRRLVLLGARRDVDLPQYPQPTSNAPRRRNASQLRLDETLPQCPTVAEAIGDLPNIDDYDSLRSSDELTISLRGGSEYARRLRGELPDPQDYSHPRQTPRLALSGCQRADHTDVSRERFASTTPGTTEPVSRFFKLSDDGVCNTLRAGTATDRGAFTSPRPIHPRHNRCISIREAARLHSYPDWFRFHRTIWHGFREIGNSVPPLLARAIGAEFLGALGAHPIRPRGLILISPNGHAAFNMSQAAAHFGVDRHVVPPRTRRHKALT